MTFPDAVEPEDLVVDAGRTEAEGEATLPEAALPVPESTPEGRRREFDR